MADYDQAYDLIIVGRGTAAAAFANTLDFETMFYWRDKPEDSQVLVIGDLDAWKGARGETKNAPLAPNNKINQTWQMVSQYSKTVPKFARGGWEVMVDRKEYAHKNEQILQNFRNVTLIDATIESVSDNVRIIGTSRAIPGYAVWTKMGKKYWTEKLVLASGAGPHRVPPFLEKVASNNNFVMDMDRFGREVEQLHAGYRQKNQASRKMKIIVFGGNATLDSVEIARFARFDCDVTWLADADPVILGTNHQTASIALKNGVVKYSNKATDPKYPRIEWKPNSIGNDQILCQVGNETVKGDILVYGVGQDDVEATKYISGSLKSQLLPLFDNNQRFGDVHESVLGLCSKHPLGDSKRGRYDVLVVGALAQQVASKLPMCRAKDAYAEALAPMIKELQEMCLVAEHENADPNVKFLFEKNIYWYVQNSGHAIQPIVDIEQRLRAANALIVNTVENKAKKRLYNRLTSLCTLILNLIKVYVHFGAIEHSIKHDPKISAERKDANFWKELLNNACKDLTPSTIASPQLGSVIVTTAATNGFQPAYVGPLGDANFNLDDRTILRVFIGWNFPFVPETEAAKVIQEVMWKRRLLGFNDSFGISDIDALDIKERLAAINRKGQLEASGQSM
jgi:hypothetical protein